MKTHSTITMAVVAFLAVCGGAQARVGGGRPRALRAIDAACEAAPFSVSAARGLTGAPITLTWAPMEGFDNVFVSVGAPASCETKANGSFVDPDCIPEHLEPETVPNTGSYTFATGLNTPGVAVAFVEAVGGAGQPTSMCARLAEFTLITPAAAAAACSAKSCSDLGLPLGSNADVCGNSFEFGANGRATSTCLGGALRAAATHADAEAMCKNIGMRLCSVREVAAGELQFTGCGRDKMQVWTSTPCAAHGLGPKDQWTATGFATMRGNGAGPASCPIAGAQAEVRCCADSVHGSCTDFRTGTVDPPTPRTTTTVGALAATYQESALGSGFDDTAGAYLRSVGGSHGGCENRARREGAVYYSYATASKTCKVLKPEHQASEDDVAAFLVDPAKAMAGTKLYQLTWAPVTDLCSGDGR